MPNSYPLIFKTAVVNYYYAKKSSVSDLLDIFKISKSTLYNWIKLYKNNNLTEKKKYSKKSKFSDNMRKFINNYVIKNITFDYISLIKRIKRRFKMNLSKSSLYNILKKEYITRKKVYIRVNLCDKKKFRNKKKEMIEKIKSVDMKKIIFIDFIKEIVNKTGNDNILFMDNAVIHHAKDLTEYVNSVNREIIYNVPYSPEYNPIEMVFSKVKLMVKKKRTNENIEALKRNIRYGFNKITKNNLKNYFLKSLNF